MELLYSVTGASEPEGQQLVDDLIAEIASILRAYARSFASATTQTLACEQLATMAAEEV